MNQVSSESKNKGPNKKENKRIFGRALFGRNRYLLLFLFFFVAVIF